jgi:outer membrane beta-barrel protein
VNLPPAARALALALLLGALAAPGAARAAKGDAFEGKIEPISGQLYEKRHRLELTPSGQLSMNDSFFTKYFGGLSATWHLTEFLAVSASWAGGATGTTGSAVVCPANQGCVKAGPGALAQVPGRIRSIAGLELGWTPVYGKLNVLAQQVVHFDLGLRIGADFITADRVLAADQVAAGVTASSKGSPGAHLGLGARFFLTEALAVRLEVKDYLYQVTVPNGLDASNRTTSLQNQLFTELGLSVFFPFRARAAEAKP